MNHYYHYSNIPIPSFHGMEDDNENNYTYNYSVSYSNNDNSHTTATTAGTSTTTSSTHSNRNMKQQQPQQQQEQLRERAAAVAAAASEPCCVRKRHFNDSNHALYQDYDYHNNNNNNRSSSSSNKRARLDSSATTTGMTANHHAATTTTTTTATMFVPFFPGVPVAAVAAAAAAATRPIRTQGYNNNSAQQQQHHLPLPLFPAAAAASHALAYCAGQTSTTTSSSTTPRRMCVFPNNNNTSFVASVHPQQQRLYQHYHYPQYPQHQQHQRPPLPLVPPAAVVAAAVPPPPATPVLTPQQQLMLNTLHEIHELWRSLKSTTVVTNSSPPKHQSQHSQQQLQPSVPSASVIRSTVRRIWSLYTEQCTSACIQSITVKAMTSLLASERLRPEVIRALLQSLYKLLTTSQTVQQGRVVLTSQQQQQHAATVTLEGFKLLQAHIIPNHNTTSSTTNNKHHITATMYADALYGVKVVLGLLRQFPDSTPIHAVGWDLIRRFKVNLYDPADLLEQHDNNCSTAGSGGGVTTLFDSLRRHMRTSISVVQMAFNLTAWLAEDATCRYVMTHECAAVPTIAACMQLYLADILIQCNGAATLCWLVLAAPTCSSSTPLSSTTTSNRNNDSAALDDNNNAAAAAAASPASIGVQSSSSENYNNNNNSTEPAAAATNNSRSSTVMTTADATDLNPYIPTILQSLEMHLQQPSVFGNMVCLLAGLNVRVVLATSRRCIFSWILAGMQHHVTTAKVQESCLRWIRYCQFSLVTTTNTTATTEDGETEEEEEGGLQSIMLKQLLLPSIDRIIDAMRAHARDAHLQAQACDVLAAMAEMDFVTLRPALLASNAIDAALSALQEHPHDKRVQQGTLWFLTLALPMIGLTRVVNRAAVAAVAVAVENHNNHGDHAVHDDNDNHNNNRGEDRDVGAPDAAAADDVVAAAADAIVPVGEQSAAAAFGGGFAALGMICRTLGIGPDAPQQAQPQ